MKIILLALISAISFCYPPAEAQTSAQSNPDKIIYRFKDASVAPAYHRSYTITVTETEATIAVSDYEKVLNKAAVKLDKKRFKETARVLRDAKIGRGNEIANAGCTGGTSESIELFNNGKQIFSESVYHCGGANYAASTGDFAAVKANLKSLFPKLEKTLK